MNQPRTDTLSGRIALVTGASRGLGRDISMALARAGAAVACVARSAERAEDTVEAIGRFGARGLALAAHVEREGDVEAMFHATEAALGPVDILVNNVGVARRKPVVEMTEADWNEHFDINAKSVFLCSRRAAQAMIGRNLPGAIISISSIAGQNAFPERLGYCGSKAAVEHMTRVMAIEWATNKIRVNCIAPGYVLTEAIQWFAKKGIINLDALARRTPMGRLGEGCDVGAAVVYLAGESGNYVTGTTLLVDGGWTAYGYI